MSNDLRARGARFLKRASHIANEDVTTAMAHDDWNLAIRRAQEATELAVKAGILLLGSEPIPTHSAAIVEKLVEVARQAVGLFYPVRRRDGRIELSKRVGGTRTVLAVHPVNEAAATGRITLDRDGSTTAAYVDGKLVLAVTDTAYSIPIGSDASEWRSLDSAVEWLADRRESSFYEEKSYSPEDAEQARALARSTLAAIEREFHILP